VQSGGTPASAELIGAGISARADGNVPIPERYLARTRRLAEQANFNFENSIRTKFANQSAPQQKKIQCLTIRWRASRIKTASTYTIGIAL
jgi:hypothetical protein